MAPTTDHQLRTLYRTLLVFATFGVLILCVGLVEFVYFERPGQSTGVRATIVGVYRYDAASRQTSGPDRSEFARADEFAAVVDFGSLPSNLSVDARWYDSFGSLRGTVGPATAGQLAAKTVVPVEVPQGNKFVLPGRYTFVVERLSGGMPVEVLARRFVVVDRT